MKIIKNRDFGENVSYILAYHWKGNPGSGFAFDCDEHGNVMPFSYPEAANPNWELCQREAAKPQAEATIIFEGIRCHSYNWTSPPEGKCVCGEIVILDEFTNPCECGRDYNSAGQLLAPREQWGYETGESLGDILRIAVQN